MSGSLSRLNIVGIGPGNDEHITPAALKAIQEAHYVIGYTTYIGLVRHHLGGKQVTRTGMTEEISRARNAVETAAAGNIVTLISSGDSGVYGMAGLVFEVLRERGWTRGQSPEIRLIPGVTAANSCASLVGAPLIHDTCRISLSDLLTPWPVIEKRIKCAAQGDFVICLYNPASGRRQRQIVEASRIIKEHRSGSTPVALIKSAYRKQQSTVISDLDHFLDFEIGMNTTVLIGSSNTFVFEGYMVTPRGHTNKYRIDDGTVLEGQRKAFSLVCDGDMASRSLDGLAPKLNITKIEGAFMRTSTELYEDDGTKDLDVEIDENIDEEIDENITESIHEELAEVCINKNEAPKTNSQVPTDSSVKNALAALSILNGKKLAKPEKPHSMDNETRNQSIGFIARLAGGIIFKTDHQYFLVGDLKEPCCFEEFGFQDPQILLDDVLEIRPLAVIAQSRVDRLPWNIAVAFNGEDGAKEVYRRFIIYRNSSVSERLTELVRDVSGTIEINKRTYVDGRWLSTTPQSIWEIVRDQVLKCL